MKDKSQIELEKKVALLEQRVSFLEQTILEILGKLNDMLDDLIEKENRND